MHILDMSGYYFPTQNYFHQRAPGQVIKPTLADYYDYAYTNYVNQEILPAGIQYPTFPAYVNPATVQPTPAPAPAPQKYSAGVSPYLVLGLVVIGGIVVVGLLKKSGKLTKLFGAETFSSQEFEEMDKPYQDDGVVAEKKKIFECGCASDGPDIDLYSATDPAVRQQIIDDILGGAKDMNILASKYNVSKGVVYNIRYDLQVSGKMPYLRNPRKAGTRRGGKTSTPAPISEPAPASVPEPATEPDTGMYVVEGNGGQGWKHMSGPISKAKADEYYNILSVASTPKVRVVPYDPAKHPDKKKKKHVHITPPEPEYYEPEPETPELEPIIPEPEILPTSPAPILPATEKPDEVNVAKAIIDGRNYTSLLAQFGKDVDPVLIDLIWEGKVVESSAGEFEPAKGGV